MKVYYRLLFHKDSLNTWIQYSYNAYGQYAERMLEFPNKTHGWSDRWIKNYIKQHDTLVNSLNITLKPIPDNYKFSAILYAMING
jgi:hypothetical protein